MVKTKHILIALAVIGANVLLNMPVHKAFAATPYDNWYGTTGGFVHTWPNPAVVSGVNLTIDDTTCNIDDEPKHADSVSLNIYGGYTTGNDTVSNNSLTIALNSVQVNAKIYAGYSYEGEASGNKLIINSGTINDPVYGGYSIRGDASGNKLIINSGTINNDVYGGYSNYTGLGSGSGKVSKNEVTINSGTINKDVYGGSSSVDEVSENKLFINNVTIVGSVYGGRTGSGVASKNEVTINNSTITGEVYGGYTNAFDDAIGNEVTIKNGTISNGPVSGGYSHGGNVTNNSITIEGGTFNNVTLHGGSGPLAGYGGNATDNSITIEGGTFNNVTLYGGSCGSGKTSSGNTLNLKTVINGTIKEIAKFQNVNFTIPAGMDREMTMLKVTTIPMVLDGVTFNVQNWSDGDYITLVKGVNGTEGALAGHTNFYVLDIGGTKELVYANGTPTARADYTIKQGDVRGESETAGSYTSTIKGNTDGAGLTVTGGSLSSTSYSGNEIIIRRGTYDSPTAVAGAYNTTNDAISNNTVKIYDGTLKGIIYGGYSSSSGAVSGNKVNIYGGTLGEDNTINIYGGDSISGNATGNVVNIEGGTFANGAFIRGGYSNSGNATKNTLSIKGGTFSGASNNFYGGESSNGNANENKVDVGGGTFEGNATIYGGYSLTTGGASKNIVNITNSTMGSGSSVVGGHAVTGDADNNYVKISKSTFAEGQITAGNTVGGNAHDNELVVESGSYDSCQIYGGMTYSGDANNNTVSILNDNDTDGGVMVFGAVAESGNAKENTVNIGQADGTTTFSKMKFLGLYGGYGGPESSGNKLNLYTRITMTGDAEVGRFQEMNFYLPEDIATGDTILNNATMAFDENGTKINVDVLGEITIAKDTVINLINVSGGMTGLYGVDKIFGVVATVDAGAYSTSVAKIEKSGNVISLTMLEDYVQDVWYTIGSEEKILGSTAPAQTISNADGDVVLYHGAGENNEYGAITTAKSVTVGAETEIGKSFLVSGDLTAAEGVTVAAKNTLNIAADNLKSAVANNGTVVLQAGTLAEGKTITGGTVKITEDVSTIGTNLLDGSGNNMNVQITDGKTLIVSGGSLAVAVGDSTNNKGTVKFTGTTTAGKEIYTAVEVGATTGALTVAADLLKNESNTNYGTLTLTGDNKTLGNSISGSGTTVVNGSVTVENGRSITQAALTINNGRSLTAEVDALTIGGGTGSITNEGTLTLTADGTTDDPMYESITGGTTSILNFNGNNKITAEGAVTQGTVNVNTDVDMNAALTAAVNVVADKTLTIGADNLNSTVANSGTVALKEGTLASGKTISGGSVNIIGDVEANAGDIAGDTNTIAADKTLTLNGGTLADNITGDGNVTIGNGADAAEVTAALTKFGNTGDLTVNANGTLVTGGALSRDFKGTGTVQLNADTNLANGKKIEGTLDGNGKNVTIGDSSSNGIFNVGTLAGNIGLSIDVDLSDNSSDKLSIGAADGAVLNLVNINITNDVELPDPFNVPEQKNDAYVLTYADGAGANSVTYNLSETEKDSVATSGGFVYEFAKGTAGTLKYKVKATDLTFKKFVEGDLQDVRTLSLTGDLESNGDIGTIEQVPNSITVNLNGYNLSSASESNIIVASGKTLNLNGDGTVDGNTNFIVDGAMNITGETAVDGILAGAGTYTNSGTLNIADAGNLQMTNGLTNNGTLNLNGDGTLATGRTISGGTVNVNGNVTANADDIAGETNNVAEGKTLTLKDGTLGGNLSGTGSVVVTGTVASGKNIANSVEVASTGDFTVSGGMIALVDNKGTMTVTSLSSLTDDITNSGTVNLNGDGTLATGMTISGGTVNVNGNVTANADDIAGETNNVAEGKTLTLEDGTLGGNLSGTGSIVVAGTVASGKNIANNVEVKADAALTNSGTISGAVENAGTMTTTANGITGGVTNTRVLELTDGNLGSDITGTGSTNITGEVTNDGGKEIAQAALTISSDGTLKTNADKLNISSNEIINKGTMTLTDGTLQEKLVDATGSLTIDGDVVALNNITQGNLTINSGKTMSMTESGRNLTIANDIDNQGTLIIGASELQSNVANSGTVTLKDGTLATGRTISGGTLNVNGNVTANADDIAGETNNVAEGKTLTLEDGTLGGNLSGTGSIVVAGTVASGKNIANNVAVDEEGTLTNSGTISGAVENAGTMTTTANGITGGVANSGVVSGPLTNSGTFDNTNGALGGRVSNNGGTLTTKLNGISNWDSGNVSNRGILNIIDGGALSGQNITNTNGTINLSGDYTLDWANVASGLIIDGGSVDASSSTLTLTGMTKENKDKKVKLLDLTNGATGSGKWAGLEKEKVYNMKTDGEALGLEVKQLKSFMIDADGNFVVLAFGSNFVPKDGEEDGIRTGAYHVANAMAESTDENITKFIDVISDMEGSSGTAAASEALNASINIGEAGGVQHGAASMAGLIGETIGSNMSIAVRPILSGGQQATMKNMANDGDVKDAKIEEVEVAKVNEIMPVAYQEQKYEKTIWASYMHNKENINGLQLDGVKQNGTAQYNGTTVGADLWSSGKVIGGVAMAYSTGDVNSIIDQTSTKNEAKYYGVSVYNRWTNGKAGILADVGYMYAKNELTQHIGNSEMETDAKTNSLTAGVRAEQLIKLGRSNLVPFVGVRYMYLRNGEYTLNENGSDGRHYAPKNQNIITPQVGVAWNGEFTIPGSKWTFRPSVEGGYLWNIGDRDTESIVSFGGASDTIGYEVADKSSYFAKLGIDFRKGNLILGVSFKYQKGDTVTNKKWNFNVNFVF